MLVGKQNYRRKHLMKTKSRTVGQCAVCKVSFTEEDWGDGVWFNYSGPEQYTYRGFTACGDCYDELIEKVDNKRERIIENFNSRSMKSQGAALIPPYDSAGMPISTFEANQKLTARAQEIASNTNWEEENEWRKGKL